MPKAPAGPALRRNQACRQCRKRKLKCDAARPHCGTCVKQWTAQISVPPPVGFSHPVEPSCTYDPVDGLSLAPDLVDEPAERMRVLEAQIAELQHKLTEAQQTTGRSISPQHPLVGISPPSTSSLHASPAGGSQANLSPQMQAHRRVASQDVKPFVNQEIVLPQVSLNIPRHAAQAYTIDPSPIDLVTAPGLGFQDIMYVGWNRDLPDPGTLHHLIDAFFRCDPCGSRVLHRPSFLASLSLPPTHPEFPHPAILHAICASASKWISQPYSPTQDPFKKRDRFAEFHVTKTRSYFDQTMISGHNIFEVLQACIILSFWFYCEGRWVEVWIYAGFQTRTAQPLGLNYPNTHPTRPLHGVYLEPPKTIRDLECRRRAWWMAVVFDRLVSVGGWVHGVDERNIGTEFPLTQRDFECETNMQSNPQDLWTPDVFTTHEPNYTDPFLLLIKATMLFGRVTDYYVRRSVLRNPPATARGDPYRDEDFRMLDQLVVLDFLNSFPPRFRSCLGVGEAADGSLLDTDLYMAHLIPHAATITLHVPHIDVTSLRCTSAVRCIQATRAILNAYYLLASTSFDITRLHPFIATVWYLAGNVLVRLCKHLIDIGDTDGEQGVWGEINLMRFALLQYGTLCPLGLRQEKLLRDSMTDILRLTSHTAPLTVGAPLYPFSNANIFKGAAPADDELVAAPIPPAEPADEPDEPQPMYAPERAAAWAGGPLRAGYH